MEGFPVRSQVRMAPDPPSPAGGDRSGVSVATCRKWAEVRAVLATTARVEACGFILQLPLTPAVDVPMLPGTRSAPKAASGMPAPGTPDEEGPMGARTLMARTLLHRVARIRVALSMESPRSWSWMVRGW